MGIPPSYWAPYTAPYNTAMGDPLRINIALFLPRFSSALNFYDFFQGFIREKITRQVKVTATTCQP